MGELNAPSLSVAVETTPSTALSSSTTVTSWGSEAQSRKTRVIDVVYNATNNELVHTKTLVKNAIVKIDANPFRTWYLQHYNVELNKKKAAEERAEDKVEHGERWTNLRPERQKEQAVDKKVLD